VYLNLRKTLAFVLPSTQVPRYVLLAAVLGLRASRHGPDSVLWLQRWCSSRHAVPVAFETQPPGLMVQPSRRPQPLLTQADPAGAAVSLFTGGLSSAFFFGARPSAPIMTGAPWPVSSLVALPGVYHGQHQPGGREALPFGGGGLQAIFRPPPCCWG